MTGMDEKGWLIETGAQTWWDGRKTDVLDACFTRDANEAIRFARFEELGGVFAGQERQPAQVVEMPQLRRIESGSLEASPMVRHALPDV